MLPESHLILFDCRMATYPAHVRIVSYPWCLIMAAATWPPKSLISFLGSSLINRNPETPEVMMSENPSRLLHNTANPDTRQEQESGGSHCPPSLMLGRTKCPQITILSFPMTDKSSSIIHFPTFSFCSNLSSFHLLSLSLLLWFSVPFTSILCMCACVCVA